MKEKYFHIHFDKTSEGLTIAFFFSKNISIGKVLKGMIKTLLLVSSLVFFLTGHYIDLENRFSGLITLLETLYNLIKTYII